MKKDKEKKQKQDRRHKIPKEYIEAVSDRIHTTAPTLEIIENTLSGVYSLAYTRGYARRMEDAKAFKDYKKSVMARDFKLFQDFLDDEIHRKSNNQPNK